MSEQNNVTDQQLHLKSAVKQQIEIIKEINTLNNELSIKKEQATKLQGIIEYLNGLGVRLPEDSKESVPEFTEETNN
jgi:hypothetical protein